MSAKRYPQEFKIEAFNQMTEKDYSLVEVARRLGVTPDSLCAWVKMFGPDSKQHQQQFQEQTELKCLRKELARVTEERDLLKKAAHTSQESPIEVCLY